MYLHQATPERQRKDNRAHTILYGFTNIGAILVIAQKAHNIVHVEKHNAEAAQLVRDPKIFKQDMMKWGCDNARDFTNEPPGRG